MTKKELIEKIKDYPDDTEVLYVDNEMGCYFPIEQIEYTQLYRENQRFVWEEYFDVKNRLDKCEVKSKIIIKG